MMSIISIYRGDTEDIEINFTNNDGSVIDISNWTVFFTVKLLGDRSDTDDNALITKNITSHTDPTNGKTVINLTSTDTDINPSHYIYDVQVKKVDGSIKTMRYDSFIVTQDITRRTE